MAKPNEIKVGDFVRLKTDRYVSYGYPKGIRVQVTYKNGTSLNVIYLSYGAVTVTTSEVEAGPQKREEIEAEIAHFEEALKIRKEKLKWMEETKSEAYDEEEFKVWQILGTLDRKSSKIEKARAIAAIIKK